MANSITTWCRDVSRLANTGDLLTQAGTLLMKKSPRATLWTAGISSSGFLSNFIGLDGFTAVQAVAAPLIVGGGMLSLGACLKFIPSTLSRQLEDIAQANDLNLMEDYRKSQVVHHLNLLWDRVFAHEARLRCTPEAQQEESTQILAFQQQLANSLDAWDPALLRHLGAVTDQDKADLIQALITERPLSESLEKSREGFLISSLYAMRHAMPQSTQAHTIGFRLDLYEDYCDGACFDRSDRMLFQQFKGHTCLAAAKKHAGLTGLRVWRTVLPTMSQKMWFLLITRKVSAGVGRAVRSLNKAFDTDRFNAQAVLWPGEEDAAWLKDLPEAAQQIRTSRREILHGALGDTYENAEKVLDRMLLPGVKQAQDLRIHYDYEYCDQTLQVVTSETAQPTFDDAGTDLETMAYPNSVLEKKRAFLTHSVASMSRFMAYLETSRQGMMPDDSEALRAVKIMFHTNHGNIHKLLKTSDLEESRTHIDALIKEAAGDKTQYTRRLVSVRMHHQLTRLRNEEYRTLVKALAY